jgi:hypothetical protein
LNQEYIKYVNKLLESEILDTHEDLIKHVEEIKYKTSNFGINKNEYNLQLISDIIVNEFKFWNNTLNQIETKNLDLKNDTNSGI